MKKFVATLLVFLLGGVIYAQDDVIQMNHDQANQMNSLNLADPLNPISPYHPMSSQNLTHPGGASSHNVPQYHKAKRVETINPMLETLGLAFLSIAVVSLFAILFFRVPLMRKLRKTG